MQVVVLAHAGAGATWQALLVLTSFGVISIFLLGVVGKLILEEPGDLVLPLAATAVLASLSGTTSDVLSDWVGWWFPLGMAALVAVVIAATTSLTLAPNRPLAVGAVVLGLATSLLLHSAIEDAWHPTDGGTGAAWTDVELVLVQPTDGSTTPVGPVDLVVAVEGGTIGPGPGPQPGGDPEERGIVRVFVDGRLVTGQDGEAVGPVEDCAAGCVQATYPLDLTLGVHTISMEFLTADGRTFDTPSGQRPTVQIATVESR